MAWTKKTRLYIGRTCILKTKEVRGQRTRQLRNQQTSYLKKAVQCGTAKMNGRQAGIIGRETSICCCFVLNRSLCAAFADLVRFALSLSPSSRISFLFFKSFLRNIGLGKVRVSFSLFFCCFVFFSCALFSFSVFFLFFI